MAAPRYNTLTNGVTQNVAAATVATPNAVLATGSGGTIDPSFLPAGVGQDIVIVPASEAISAGAIVNLYTNSGATNARNADSGTANGGKKAAGFALAGAASGASVSVYRSGMNTALTGLSPGADYYLSTAGGVTTTPTTTSGTTSQYIGTAISATVLDVQVQQPIGIN